MDKAKPGHTVEFHGLKGAAHLNGTRGTLVEFLKTEKRWSVRCEVDNHKVNAKPENLVLCRLGAHPIIGGDYTAAKAAKLFGNPPAASPPPGGGAPSSSPSDWARGLSQKDQYEWFSNCYQMRCDDDYQWGGCNLHGPYDPEATPESIAQDFLVYCILARRSQAVPPGWDWNAFLKTAANFCVFAFEKSDAQERWGRENFFDASMGGRSLRYTATKIYKSAVDQLGDSPEHQAADEEARFNKEELQKQVGGTEAWAAFLADIAGGRRFA